MGPGLDASKVKFLIYLAVFAGLIVNQNDRSGIKQAFGCSILYQVQRNRESDRGKRS